MWLDDRDFGCMIWTLVAILLAAGGLLFKIAELLAEHLKIGWR